MRIPLFIIRKGDEIPLPHSRFQICIPQDKEDYFQTAWINEQRQVVITICHTGNPWFLMRKQRGTHLSLHDIGLLCTVEDITQNKNGDYQVDLTTGPRVYTRNTYVNTDEPGTIWLDIEYVPENFVPGEDAVIKQIKSLVQALTQPSPVEQLVDQVNHLDQTRSLISKMDILADIYIQGTSARLLYLQSGDNTERFNLLIVAVKNSTQKVPTKPKPKRKRRSLFDKPSPVQKEAAPATIEEKFQQTAFPAKIRQRLQREIKKLGTLSKSSTEYGILVDYLEWVTDIPWGQSSYKDFELSELTNNLNRTHFGLRDVKQHILEHLTVERLCGGTTGTVLCFTGPPGTGKTSIAKSIAHASGRSLQRIALGGLSDEAELRGHRRTYVGSRPGRFIVGLRQASAMDPLFLLDEVDKLARYKGDPTAALLEILDPEQNDRFIDRYVGVPVDLSKAMFICTANYPDQIPPALLDRVEQIQFREYTKEERTVILNDFLIPKAVKSYKLGDFEINFTDELLDRLSDARGIRRIEKTVKKLLRMAAVEIVVNEKDNVSVDMNFAQATINQKQEPIIGFTRR